MDRADISWNNLKEGERDAALKFLHEAFLLYKQANAEIKFVDWLNMLTEGIHEAFMLQSKRKPS